MDKVINFYFKIIGDLISNLWDRFAITPFVNYTMLFFGVLLMCSIISIYKLSLKSDMISFYKKSFSRNRSSSSIHVKKRKK